MPFMQQIIAALVKVDRIAAFIERIAPADGRQCRLSSPHSADPDGDQICGMHLADTMHATCHNNACQQPSYKPTRADVMVGLI